LVKAIQERWGQPQKNPEVLYLQLDNASSTNKNRFFLFFCALLVAWKLFKKVKVSFLLVGHTHEDIDQLFSRLSAALRLQDCHTMEKLLEISSKAFSCNDLDLVAEFLPDVPDYKAWMTPYLPKMKGHTAPMCFKFELDSAKENVVVFSRQSMNQSKRDSDCWNPAGRTRSLSVLSEFRNSSQFLFSCSTTLRECHEKFSVNLLRPQRATPWCLCRTRRNYVQALSQPSFPDRSN
jgi:hypothetical protein